MLNESKKVRPINQPSSSLTVLDESLSTYVLDDVHLRKHNIFVEDTDKTSRIAISAYKNMRTHLMREMRRRSISTLMVTGTTENVGKTTTAANLAISIAKHVDKRVVLVDFDLRKPSFSEVFNLNVDYGVDDILDDNFSLKRALIRTNLRSLFLLPCTVAHRDSAEILMSSRMRQLMSTLRQYDEDLVVIFDMPPILGCDDVAAVSEIMDAAVLVASEGMTTRDELKRVNSALGDTPLIAAVMNRSTEADFERYYY